MNDLINQGSGLIASSGIDTSLALTIGVGVFIGGLALSLLHLTFSILTAAFNRLSGLNQAVRSPAIERYTPSDNSSLKYEAVSSGNVTEFKKPD